MVFISDVSRRADAFIGGLLGLGALLGAAVIALGAALFFVERTAGVIGAAVTFPHTFSSVAIGVGQGSPLALVALGLIILLATPALQVVASLGAFLFEWDWLYVGVTALVLAILLASIFVVGPLFGQAGAVYVHDASLSFFALMFCSSLFAGFIGSLAGIGGGLLIVPILTLVFHVPFDMAVGASIVSVIATSTGSASSYVKSHLVNRRVGTFLEVATTLGAICGALLTIVVLQGNTLSIIFGFALLASIVPLTFKFSEEHPRNVQNSAVTTALQFASAYPDPQTGKLRAYNVAGVYVGFGIMYLAGLLSGLLGIGSGVFKVLAMDTAMRLPMRVSVTTSEFMIGVTAAASTGIFFLRGDIDPVIAAPIALGVLVGALLGVKVLPRLSNVALRRIFMIVMLLAALSMLARGFGWL